MEYHQLVLLSGSCVQGEMLGIALNIFCVKNNTYINVYIFM